jgi:hypothetical protein
MRLARISLGILGRTPLVESITTRLVRTGKTIALIESVTAKVATALLLAGGD